MIGICIFKGEYKEKETRGRRAVGEGWVGGQPLRCVLHTRTTRLCALPWTARSLCVSLWAKLLLLIEMGEQKGEDSGRRKEKE